MFGIEKKATRNSDSSYVFNWKDSLNLVELLIFLFAGLLMETVTSDHSFVAPMYAAYIVILLRNLYAFRKSKNHFFLYKIIFYSVLIPDNYIVIAVLIGCAIYAVFKNRLKVKRALTKRTICLIVGVCLFLVINILLSEQRWINIVFAALYLSVFPAAYVFCKLEKDGIKENFSNLVKFIKGIVIAELLCVLAFLIVNSGTVVSGIDNDWIAGTFGGQHGNLFLFFMLFAFLLIEKHYRNTRSKADIVYMIIIALISIFTNSIALTILFLLAYVVASVIRAKKIKSAFMSIAVVVVAAVFFFLVSPQWIQSYLIKLQDIAYLRANIPKIATYEETFVEIPRTDTKFMLIGNGIGQYSSRGALIATGEYIPAYNSFFEPSVSEYTQRYILEKYKRYNIDLMHGTMYSPYSSIITIFGEYGLVGLLIFSVVIFIMIRKSNKEAATFVIFFLLSCFVENYVEFAKVTIPLFFIYFIDMRERKNEK